MVFQKWQLYLPDNNSHGIQEWGSYLKQCWNVIKWSISSQFFNLVSLSLTIVNKFLVESTLFVRMSHCHVLRLQLNRLHTFPMAGFVRCTKIARIYFCIIWKQEWICLGMIDSLLSTPLTLLGPHRHKLLMFWHTFPEWGGGIWKFTDQL